MSQRILSIDAFRGFLVVSMTFNHLCLFPFMSLEKLHVGLLSLVYDHGGCLSTSEGFFFLAGLIAGILYGKLLLSEKIDELHRRVFNRVWQLYGVHLLAVISLTLLLGMSENYRHQWDIIQQKLWLTKGYEGISYLLEHPWKGFFLQSTFLYVPPFFDILPLYMLFLSATPRLLRAFHRGYLLPILVTSWGLWLFAQYIPIGFFQRFLTPYLPAKLGWFNPWSLQLIFISGLAFGYFHLKGSYIDKHQLFFTLASVLGLSFFILKITDAPLDSAHSLGLWRLAIFSLKAFLALMIQRRFHPTWLGVIGRHSLAVFTYHLFLVYGLIYFQPMINSLSSHLQLMMLVVTWMSLGILPYLLERMGKNPVKTIPQINEGSPT